MKVTHKENYTLITPETTSFTDFLSNFEENHQNLAENHLILQISESLNTTEKDILVFLKYANLHQQNGTSFVVICTNVDIDDFPENFNIVPTLTEAEDVIDMENMQRDLGF